MEAARNAYSRINPDSPWRWVPYSTLALAALTMAALTAYDPTTRSPKTSLGLLAASAVVCWWSYVKMGSPRAVLIAREWEAESGGVRVNSLPGLAFALRVLGPIFGIVVVARLIGLQKAMLTIAQGSPDSSPLFAQYFDTPLFFFAAIFFSMWGWQRPWDLKVVERDAAQEAM